MEDRFAFLKSLKINLKDKTVLDAGTGEKSAGFLAEGDPSRLVCISYKHNIMKGEDARGRLESVGFKNYKIVYGDLSNKELFHSNSFDFVLTDCLIGSLDHSKVLPVFKNLHNYLKKKFNKH